MRTVTILKLMSILFGIGGLVLVIVYAEWQVAFGIFAMLFGNNLERSVNRRSDECKGSKTIQSSTSQAHD